MTKQYSDGKACWAPGKPTHLTQIPQLRALYARAEGEFARMDAYVGACERQLCTCLRDDTIPPVELTDAIAVAKVRAVETSIQLCFALKQEVGSYALMGGTGFEQSDFLQCCKFAEGDSRILMQKMARDRLRGFQKNRDGSGSAEETRLCEELASAMASGGKNAWDDNFEKVFALAEAIMERTVRK